MNKLVSDKNVYMKYDKKNIFLCIMHHEKYIGTLQIPYMIKNFDYIFRKYIYCNTKINTF